MASCLLIFGISLFSQAENVSEKMRLLRPAMQELLIDLSDEEAFLKGKNRGRVEKRTLEISKLAHGVKAMKETPDADPSIKILAGELSNEAARAYGELKRGNLGYARHILKSVTGYCVACHSRNASGPSFPGANAPELKGMSSIQKAEFLMATRQYDSAIEKLEGMIAEPMATAPSLDWEKAIGLSLTLATRVKNDPALAERLVKRVLATPKLPKFFKRRSDAWLASIEAWKNEGSRQILTEEGLYAELVRLFTLAKSSQEYPADRSADVAYLRATRLMHDYLAAHSSGTRVAEVLQLLGTSYSVLQGLGIWDLNEHYFTACIRKAPHSSIAEKCFQQLQENIYLGYSGTGGTAIPASEQKRLDALEMEAKRLDS